MKVWKDLFFPELATNLKLLERWYLCLVKRNCKR
nr:MAG TPA: hypothetical protein [Caudoviricetes sp.]